MGFLAVFELKQIAEIERGAEDDGGPLPEPWEMPVVKAYQGGGNDRVACRMAETGMVEQ